MSLSEAVFNLVSMQCREEREAKAEREKAVRRNASKADRNNAAFVAEYHEANAAALGVAIRALVELP